MKRYQCFLFLGLLTIRAQAAPAIGSVRAIPTTAVIGTATEISVQASITDPSLIAGGANLLQLNPNGTTTILGTLHDDGLNGDAYAGDHVFTLLVTLNSSSAAQIQLEVSAAFRGMLQRVKAPTISVFFQAANAPGQSLATLAQNLAAGNIGAAQLFFVDSDRAGELFSAVGLSGIQALGGALLAAQVTASGPDLRVFSVPWVAPNGTILQLEVTLEPDLNGNWLVVAW